MKRFLMMTFLGLGSTAILAVTPQMLKGPTLPASKLVQTEVNRIYPPSSASILLNASPFADANALMIGIRNNILNTELNAINNGLYSQSYGPDGPVGEVFVNHFTLYCADSAPNDKIPGGQCQKDPLLQHADINVSSILNGSRLEGDRGDAAKVFLTNLTQPFPSTDYLDNNGQLIKDKLTDAGYRKELANVLAEQAMLSTARGALAEMIAKRTPVSTKKGTVSMMELLEKEAAGRYLNDDWQAKIQQIRDNALAAKPPNLELVVWCDIAKSSAYQDWMAYEHYRQQERIESLLSALISLNFRQAKGLSSAVGSAAATP